MPILRSVQKNCANRWIRKNYYCFSKFRYRELFRRWEFNESFTFTSENWRVTIVSHSSNFPGILNASSIRSIFLGFFSQDLCNENIKSSSICDFFENFQILIEVSQLFLSPVTCLKNLKRFGLTRFGNMICPKEFRYSGRSENIRETKNRSFSQFLLSFCLYIVYHCCHTCRKSIWNCELPVCCFDM